MSRLFKNEKLSRFSLFAIFLERVVCGRSREEPFDFLDADVIIDVELFNLVIEQVIVGSKENGEIDPYRLVFIFKDSSSTSTNAKKPSAKGKEGKSADALCSSWHDAGESLCSPTGDDACGIRCVA